MHLILIVPASLPERYDSWLFVECFVEKSLIGFCEPARGQILSPWMEDIVDFGGIKLLYRPVA
jgi:hypothetical protein